jgi:25S rRNA (adenine2142-N1)-methyltransferase
MKRSATTNIKNKKKKKYRKNKAPPSLAVPTMTSRRRARKVTTNFHRLTHEINRLKSIKDDEETSNKIRSLEQQLEEAGGRKTYQDASIVSTTMFRTSKFVTSALTRLGVRPSSGQPLPKLLEVGAINLQLLTTKWLNVDALDINSRHPKIQHINFFDFPINENKYDCVVCSMVINCIPTPIQRGKLLINCRKHLKLNGYFFLMLPLLCLNSTPFVNGKEQFRRGIQSLGFQFIEEKITNKVGLFIFQKVVDTKMNLASNIFSFPPRTVVRSNKSKKFHSDFAVSIVIENKNSISSSEIKE